MWSQSHPFSIVLCTYNGERFLDEQLRSLLVQEGVAEIIVSDDASTDGTMDILRRYAVEDKRVIVTQNQERLGVTANFEQAIRLASSPWIALSDQDDIWLPGKLARLRACWDGHAVLLHHASRKFRGSPPTHRLGHIAGERRKFSGQDWRRLLYRNSVVGHTAVFSRDLVSRILPLPSGLPHDWWIGIGAALHGHVQYLDEYLVFYRIHERNAYHAVGSRRARVREEYGLRTQLVRAILARWNLRVQEKVFAEKYLLLLHESTAGVFPWPLWFFFLRYAPLLFGGVYFERSEFAYFRKSCLAALAVMFQSEKRSTPRPARYVSR